MPYLTGRCPLKDHLYLLSHAARLADISPDTARGYCRQGLLDPLRDSSGRRLFTDDDILQMRQTYLDNMSRRRGA
jgi:DNA-binding transcriptional MerR regulator